MTNMTKIVLLATCAGLLTACGGGSDNPAMGGGGEDGEDAVPTFEQRIAAQSELAKEVRMSIDAAMKAKEDTSIEIPDFMNVQGVSEDALERAQDIIDAHGDVDQARQTAQDAYDTLFAQSLNEELSDAERNNARSLLDILGENPVRKISELLMNSDGEKTPLMMAYDAIRGDDPDMLRGADYHATRTARNVFMAIDVGLEKAPSVIKANVLDDSSVFAKGSTISDANAMTFGEIFGDLKTVAIDDDNYDAVSLKGELAQYDSSPKKDAIVEGYDYKGIIGIAVCREECVDPDPNAADLRPKEKFGEGWYFVPVEFSNGEPVQGKDKREWHFVKDGDDYKPVVNIQYGMWLWDSGGDPKLARRIGVVSGDKGPETFNMFNLKLSPQTENDPIERTASYSGEAKGLSVREVGASAVSGHFEAKVDLTAGLGADPTLHGTIDEFMSDDGAVDPDWVVTLKQRNLMPYGGHTAPRVPGSGNWNAQAFGSKDNQRPEGFYGDFHHKFDGVNYDDGRVAGVYVAHQD